MEPSEGRTHSAGLEAPARDVIDQGRAWIDEHEAELLEFLSELVSQPSVTGREGTHDDPESVVGSLYATLEAETDRATLDVQRVPDDDRGPRENCYAVLEGATDELFVCTSHTDTVAPGDDADWPGTDPYDVSVGTVRRPEPGAIELTVDGQRERRTIRDAYDRVWDRRDDTERDVLVGRGTYDNKASVVCLVGALRALESALGDRQLGGTLVHGHLVGEEIAQVGAKAMVGRGDRTGWFAERFPDPEGAVVVMDGSYGFVPAVGHRGLAWVTLSVEGESTHASTPHLGSNAVLETAKGLATVEEPSFRESIASPFIDDSLLGELTVAAGTTIIGGDVRRDREGRLERAGVNAVPDWCETTFDVRFPRWEAYPNDPEAIRAHLEETIASHVEAEAGDVDVTATVDPAEYFPPVALADSREAARNHPLVSQTIEAARSTVGYDPGVTVAPGVTDAASIYSATRLPTIVEYGPAGALSHEPLEFVERESVIDGAKAMIELTIRQLGVV